AFSNEDAVVPVIEAGNALVLDGVDDYILADSVDLVSTDFTIEFWVKRNAVGNLIISQGALPASTNNFLDIGFEVTSNIYMEFWNNRIQSSYTFDNNWHHIAFTANRSTGERVLYIDGKYETSNFSGIYTGQGKLYIGAESMTLGGPFNGSLDELRIWNHVRSQSQISDQMTKSLRGDEVGLMNLWHFDESDPGTIVYEGSTSANDGVLNNGQGNNFTPSGAMAPVAPAGVYAIAHNGQVELKWNKNTDADFFRYHVYSGITANPTTDIGTTTDGDVNDTTFIATGLVNGQMYYFRVAGEDSAGQIGNYSTQDAAVSVVESGNALALEAGNSEYVALPSTFENITMTISAWIKPSSAQQHAIWSNRGSSGTNEDGFALGLLPDGTLYYEYGFPSGAVSTSSGQIPINSWTHVALTLDGSIARLYVNGVEQANGAYSRTTSGVNAWIGGYNNGWGTFDGQIDELSIWNYALAPAQITSGLAKPYRGDEVGLVALYHLDEPSASTTALDASPNAYNGNLVNGADFVTSTAMAPTAVAGISATTFFPDSVRITWNHNSETDLKKYIIYRSTTPGFIPSLTDSIDQTAVGDTAFVDVNAVVGNIYYYRVSAVDSADQAGVYSSDVSADFDPLLVKNTADAGEGSLRAAIAAAASLPGADSIRFAISNATIFIDSDLDINDASGPVVIDGETNNNTVQVSVSFPFGDNTIFSVQSPNVTIRNMTLDAQNGSAQARFGIFFDDAGLAGDNSKAENLTVRNAQRYGIIGQTSNDSVINSTIYNNAWGGVGSTGANWVIRNNRIGTDATGTIGLGNQDLGVYIFAMATVDSNIIAGNDSTGIYAAGPLNTIRGNRIGIGSDNSTIPNNYHGIALNAGGGSQIIGNVISNHPQSGILIAGSSYNKVQDNLIGTDASGIIGYPNLIGISLIGGSKYNEIGDTLGVNQNVISGNTNTGILITDAGTDSNYVWGNLIGTDINGTSDLGNGSWGIALDNNSMHTAIGGMTSNHRNVISGNGNSGILMQGFSAHNVVQGNYIGTDINGNVDLGNTQSGVFILNQAHDNIVGGTSPGAGNVISGNNNSGITIGNIGTRGQIIQGNLIGTNATGNAAISNGSGVVLNSGHANLVGGTVAGARNVISGNTNSGIEITNVGSDTNLVQGNFIGTDVNGTVPLGNGIGVTISEGGSGSPRLNLIGGATAAERNIISASTNYGVWFINSSENKVQGNYIGTDVTGTQNLGNSSDAINLSNGASRDSIMGNTIAFSNTNAIAMLNSGTDSIIVHDNVIFGNGNGFYLQAGTQSDITPPQIISVGADSTVYGIASPNAFIQVYADSINQGRFKLGTTTANASGDWSLKVNIPAGTAITAMQDSAQGTSAFSMPFAPQPEIVVYTLTGTYLDYGGIFSGNGQIDTVFVKNIGAGALDITSLSIENGSSQFTIVDTLPNNLTLTPGDSVKLVVRFLPDGFSSYADSV
ncbi:MAG TPA: right-handed parallel beta-helix repeat-containing protein, partial [bacterium]|nr:right-handed parallel beta-helix repeat-containing protein [bacterium]